MTRLIPSFLRCAGYLLFWIGILFAATILWDRYRQHHWWSLGAVESLVIPVCVTPTALWFMFVPRLLEFSDEEITIHLWFRGRQTRNWSDLTYYGSTSSVFLLQFGDEQAFQIFPQAYSTSQWREFRTWMEARFPDQKATGWIGPRGFRWGKKR